MLEVVEAILVIGTVVVVVDVFADIITCINSILIDLEVVVSSLHES